MSMLPSQGNACGVVGRVPKDVMGIVSGLQWALVFTRWAVSLRSPPTVDQIRERFGVSRATGYRYKAAWEAAVGANLVPPPSSLRALYSVNRNPSP